jgi:hypothetical protein
MEEGGRLEAGQRNEQSLSEGGEVLGLEAAGRTGCNPSLSCEFCARSGFAGSFGLKIHQAMSPVLCLQTSCKCFLLPIRFHVS